MAMEKEKTGVLPIRYKGDRTTRYRIPPMVFGGSPARLADVNLLGFLDEVTNQSILFPPSIRRWNRDRLAFAFAIIFASFALSWR